MTDDDPRDDPRDETQAITPIDEPTRAMPATDDPTRAMPVADEATRRMDAQAPGGSEATRRMDTGAQPTPTRRMERQAVTSSPATERLVVPGTGRGIGSWLIATVVVVALIVGGVVGYTQHAPSDRNVVARSLVGTGGGVMTFDGVGKLTIPSGALSSPTAITVRQVTIDERVRLGAEGDANAVTYEPGELVVYAFEPADLRFQQPVKIELPRRGDGSAVFVDARGAPRVMPGDADGNLVKIETSSFAFDDTDTAG